MPDSSENPVYLKLVETLETGFNALDVPVQKEIREFIAGRQHKSGGFMDRAGNPDLYYSLFGLWLSIATGQTRLQEQLNDFMDNRKAGHSQSVVEELASLLILSHLTPDMPKRSIFTIVDRVRKKGQLMDLSYQFFLVSLTVDAVGKNKKLYYFMAKLCSFFYKPKGNFPCSVSAAMLYARKILGLKRHKHKKDLMRFSLDEGGFRAFETVDTADTLSTGVALFALKETEADIRTIRPACLGFIQDNYSEGAFLSGDGDLTRDLEYTFYGLLALGALLQDER